LPRKRDSYEGESPYGTGRIEGAPLISKFRGDHAFLSNFWAEPFDCGGRIVPTAEHAFQAQKTTSKLHKDAIVEADGPLHAKFLGHRAPMRPDWDDVKVGVMRRILAFKFAPGTELAEKLVATFPAHLIEGNHWGDTFWGCVHPTPGSNLWVGANHLGILLMERRAELMREVTT
jgi:ribA/ribD-fused uncharacterized protein